MIGPACPPAAFWPRLIDDTERPLRHAASARAAPYRLTLLSDVFHERIVRIDRAVAEVRKFQAATGRMNIEASKLSAETRKLGRDVRLSSFVMAVTFVSAVGELVAGILNLLRASRPGHG